MENKLFLISLRNQKNLIRKAKIKKFVKGKK